ncbi:hypothetical protein WA026_010051 [Henosepilachna vigintioctopunctata]|uniref:Palmitoyltransferase n=1 Tax=Henosepilachna vigintioctopunctata TaxID=420089 RepID=A0AAW1UC01_9CUCU
MCFGQFSRLCHWGPLSALGIIKCVTGVTLHCNNIIWAGNSSTASMNLLCFMSLSGLTLYNFLSAAVHGPGFLPLNWAPDNLSDVKYMQFCKLCNSYKAPRSHHCRKCKRCVLKMDHHCPWINNCVGWRNHGHFVAFLAFAVLGCLHASFILMYTLYASIYRIQLLHHSKQTAILGLHGTIMCVLSLGFAVGVVLAVGMLFIFQVRAIARNRTGIEDWIMEKADYRRKNSGTKFTYPYDLGLLRNVKQVVNWTCNPVGDGITWETIEGRDQYSLTKEQLRQKKDKRNRARMYIVGKSYSGRWFPVSHGFKVLCHPPCTDEERIDLQYGDKILVTRWHKYWLFGEKIQDSISLLERKRGWFPRQCVSESYEEDLPTLSEDKCDKKKSSRLIFST